MCKLFKEWKCIANKNKAEEEDVDHCFYAEVRYHAKLYFLGTEAIIYRPTSGSHQQQWSMRWAVAIVKIPFGTALSHIRGPDFGDHFTSYPAPC